MTENLALVCYGLVFNNSKSYPRLNLSSRQAVDVSILFNTKQQYGIAIDDQSKMVIMILG